MNPVIEREFEKIRAPLPPIDDTTKVIRIAKYQPEPQISFQVAGRYLVGLPEYIVNEPANYNLSANWNRGITPQSTCLLVYVTQVFGKMEKVNAQGYDYLQQCVLQDIYEGLWLPIESVTIISKL